MACVESVEIVNEIIVENGCPTKQKVAKHCTKNTFGRKKRVINAQQLRAARKCCYPASKPVAPVTATGAIALSASATPRSTTSIDDDGGCPLQSVSSSKLALLKAASDQEDLVPSDDTNGK